MEAEQLQSPLTRQQVRVPLFIRTEPTSQPTPTAVAVGTSGAVGGARVQQLPLSGSMESNGPLPSAARELLMNVKQDDEQDHDVRRKRGRRSPIPSQIEKRYAKMGILYSSSPAPSQTLPALTTTLSPRYRGVGGGGDRGPSPLPTRPVSYSEAVRRAGPPYPRDSFCSLSPNETSLDFQSKSLEVGGVLFQPPPLSGADVTHSPLRKPSPTNVSGTAGARSSPPIQFKAMGGASVHGVGDVVRPEGSSPGSGGVGSASLSSKGSSASSPDSGYGNTPETCTSATGTTSNVCTSTARASGSGAFVSESRVSSAAATHNHEGGPEASKLPDWVKPRVQGEMVRNGPFGPEGSHDTFLSRRNGSTENVTSSNISVGTFGKQYHPLHRADLGRLSGSSPELILTTSTSTTTLRPGDDEEEGDFERRRSSSADNLFQGDHGEGGGVSSTPVTSLAPPFPYPSPPSPYTSLLTYPHPSSMPYQEHGPPFGPATASLRKRPEAFSQSLGTRTALSTGGQTGLGSGENEGGGSEWRQRPRSQRIDSTDPIELALQEVVARRKRQRSFSQPLVKSAGENMYMHCI